MTDIEQIVLAAKKSELKFLPVGTASTAQLLGKVWLQPAENEEEEKKYIPDLPKLIISGTATHTTIDQLECLEESEAYENVFFEELDMQTVLGGVQETFVQKIVNKLAVNNIVVIHASDLIKNFDGFFHHAPSFG